jgi:hypothetical protein
VVITSTFDQYHFISNAEAYFLKYVPLKRIFRPTGPPDRLKQKSEIFYGQIIGYWKLGWILWISILVVSLRENRDGFLSRN